MKPVFHPPTSDCQRCLTHMVTQLLALRDALTGLSLALTDWQFEVDDVGRREAQATTLRLIEQLGLTHGP
jgi:hypothetical protein